MICLAENLTALGALCGDSPYGCQIMSAANGYGLDLPFAQFWTDAHAAYGKLDGVVRIAGEIEDAEEATGFLSAVGAERVFCSLENAEKLDLEVLERGVVLEKTLSGEAQPGEVFSLQKLYGVLKENGMVGEFEPFYLDLSHRVRHGTAVCAALCDEAGGMDAAAVAVLGAKSSLISAVAVRPKLHRQGFGRKIVHNIETQLGAGKVYILRAKHENERFYASLGYTPCGVWCSGKIK